VVALLAVVLMLALVVTAGSTTTSSNRDCHRIYKRSTEMTVKGTPTLDKLVGWLQQHTHLQPDKLEPATVGGVEGERFDVIVGDRPESHEGLCGTPCVDLLRISDRNIWPVKEGARVGYDLLPFYLLHPHVLHEAGNGRGLLLGGG
jgi:hypothetical protein